MAKPKQKTLRAADVHALRGEALRLLAAWQSYYESDEGMHDAGSCVLGNGVSVMFTPKGRRKPIKVLIVSNADLGYQSEQPAFFRDVIARLAENNPGVAFSYECGVMD